MKKNKLFLVFVVALSLFVLVACSTEPKNESNNISDDESLKNVLDSNVFRVGLCPEYPPFESIDENNNIVGFDPSLATEIANKMGVNVKFENTPWEGLIAGLNNGNFDVIMSAMSPEEATAATEAVELSENYYTLADVIVVRTDNKDINSKEDLKDKVVGFQDASAAAQAAERLSEMNIIVNKLNRYNRNAEAYAELSNGRIDAIIVGKSYAIEQAKNNPEFRVIDDPISELGISVVAKHGSVALIEKVEEIIEQLKNDGTYDSIVVEWMAAE